MVGAHASASSAGGGAAIEGGESGCIPENSAMFAPYDGGIFGLATETGPAGRVAHLNAATAGSKSTDTGPPRSSCHEVLTLAIAASLCSGVSLTNEARGLACARSRGTIEKTDPRMLFASRSAIAMGSSRYTAETEETRAL